MAEKIHRPTTKDVVAGLDYILEHEAKRLSQQEFEMVADAALMLEQQAEEIDKLSQVMVNARASAHSIIINSQDLHDERRKK